MIDTGYKFKNENLLLRALTHSSYANENSGGDNERLEFLGDAVLELVVSTYLFEMFGDWPEGQLTKVRSGIVCEGTLAECAEQIGVGESLRVGNGEEKTGGRHRKSLLSDALEAVIGAIYLDGGYDSARDFIMSRIVGAVDIRTVYKDSKTRLQEVVQSADLGRLYYKIISETGPSHRKTFSVQACIGTKCIGEGTGHSKKEAEQNAAEAALETLNR